MAGSPQQLLEAAKAKYAFINNNPLHVTYGSAERNPNGFYAETWSPGDIDYGYAKRPEDVPLDVTGIEIFKPESFSEDDLAGEVMHVDKFARKSASEILKTLTPEQMDAVLDNSDDYEASIKLGLPKERAIQNAIDSMIRGYVVNQWPKEVIDSIGLNDKQKTILENLKGYLKTGLTPDQQEQSGFDDYSRK